MQATVDEVGRVAAAEGIDCHFAKGGTLVLARTAGAAGPRRGPRSRRSAAGLRRRTWRWLGRTRLARAAARPACSARIYTPHCAAIHPARLVRGLAGRSSGCGVRDLRADAGSPSIAPGAVGDRPRHRCGRDVVVRATEGYTPRCAGIGATLAPLYSLMIATEPLPASFWDRVGLAQRETFADVRHLIIYGQRTADDRLAFGGRGAPYHFGSRVRRRRSTRTPRVHAALAATLVELFPALGPAPPSRTAGAARSACPATGRRRSASTATTGLAWAGGYVGDGVGTTQPRRPHARRPDHRHATSPLTRLPWVGHRSRRWEPEPLRWLGINAGLRIMDLADARENRTGRPFRPPPSDPPRRPVTPPVPTAFPPFPTASPPFPTASPRSRPRPVSADRQATCGELVRARFSSKKPSVPATSSTPSHRRPAASPRGVGVTTGPKKA